jgi:DNA-binding SARP family transcriptional activator
MSATAVETREEPATEPASAGRSAVWRLELFGGCRLRAPDGTDRTPVGRKTRGLLAVLALAAGQPVTRERLAGLLWAERPEEQARASLRQALRELRQCLPDPGPLRVDRDRVALAVDRVEVDALRLAAGAAGSGSDELPAGELLEGLDGLGGPFEAWLAGQRARWRNLALEALERKLEAASDPSTRAALATRILALEPAHEPAHRALMLLHAQRGDTAAAIRQYELCREALDRLLDARPSEPTQRLLARIRAGAVAGPGTIEAGAGDETAEDGTSLVVLPFREQDRPRDLPPLGEGLAEEISAALVRFRWIAVVAPSSAVVLARELADPRAIARRLGARYLLCGRIGRAAGALRLRVELVEPQTARLLWTDDEILRPATPDEAGAGLAEAIAARVARELVVRESTRADRPATPRGEAHLLVLKAARSVFALDLPRLVEAAGLVRRAIELDPDRALAHAWLATVQLLRAGYPWRPGHAELVAEAAAAASRAVELDPLEPLALCTLAQIRALGRDLDEALVLCERAIAINPALPMAWGRRAVIHCYRGEPEAALAAMARYRRLSPFDPFQGLFGRAEVFAHLLTGRFAAAVAAGRPLFGRRPLLFGYYLPMLSALGHLGEREQARALLADVYRIEPSFTLEAFRHHYPLRRARDLELYAEGLRRAGLRERLPGEA